MHSRLVHLLFAFVFAVALGACGKKAEPPPPSAPAPAPAPAPMPAPAPAGVTLSSVSLGKSVGADKKVTAASEVFAKRATRSTPQSTPAAPDGRHWRRSGSTRRTASPSR